MLQVYEMAVDTILLSFCEDCMSNNETPQYAPKLLMSALGKASAFKKQQEERASKKVADASAKKGPTP
jgi:choline transporter-like protein 2/4/5